jgi:hypothetical protein
MGAGDEDLAGNVIQLRDAFGRDDLDQGEAGRNTRKYWFGRNACSLSSA